MAKKRRNSRCLKHLATRKEHCPYCEVEALEDLRRMWRGKALELFHELDAAKHRIEELENERKRT